MSRGDFAAAMSRTISSTVGTRGRFLCRLRVWTNRATLVRTGAAEFQEVKERTERVQLLIETSPAEPAIVLKEGQVSPYVEVFDFGEAHGPDKPAEVGYQIIVCPAGVGRVILDRKPLGELLGQEKIVLRVGSDGLGIGRPDS